MSEKEEWQRRSGGREGRRRRPEAGGWRRCVRVLRWLEQLEAVDTDDVIPMAHPLHMAQRLRIDEVTEQNQRDVFQVIAPKVDAGLYLVPKVIE